MSKLATKWILDNAVNDVKLRLRNNFWLRARNAAGDADVNVVKVNASDVIEFASVPEVGADASTNNGLVRKSQLDTAIGTRIASTEKGAANGVATLDANSLIPIAQIPPAALERLVIVADEAARLALTTATVQNGDTVKQTDTGVMYYVKDDTQLNLAAGYEVYSAGTASAVAWSGVTGTPTTIAGYGITDFNSTFDTQLATKSTTDLAEGTNLYYTNARFDTQLATKSTTDLAEGTNLYFTDGRAQTAAVVNSTAGAETVQAASVSSMKSYVAGEIAAIPAGAEERENIITLAAGDITNGYVDLSLAAQNAASIVVTPVNGPMQQKNSDYTILLTGGVAGVTRITFAGDLLGLEAGDILMIQFSA